MSSHEKKGYQYYFKKGEGSEKKISQPKTIINRQYIKYENYQKMKQSGIHTNSVNKSFKYQRMSELSYSSQRGSLYSSGYTPSTLPQKRQPSIKDTAQKFRPNFITPNNPLLEEEIVTQGLFEKKVKEFKLEEANRINRFQQNQNQFLSGDSIKKDENVKHFQSVDLRHKHKYLTSFIDSSTGDKSISWSNSKVDQLKVAHSEMTKINYFMGIKIEAKQGLKQQNQNESFQKQLKRQNNEGNAKIKGSCQQCVNLGQKVVKIQVEICQLEKKRKMNLDQILRQQKYIKQMQTCNDDNRIQLKTKCTEISVLNHKIQTIQRERKQLGQQHQSLQKQFSAKVQQQVDKIRQDYELRLKSPDEKLSTYSSHIIKLNKKNVQMEQNHRQNHKQMFFKYEKQIEQIKVFHAQQIQEVREALKQESITIGKQYQDQQKKLVQRHQLQVQVAKQRESEEVFRISEENQKSVQSLKNQHESKENLMAKNHQQILALLNINIENLQYQVQSIPALNTSIQKLESQILLQKSRAYRVQKEFSNCKIYAQSLCKEKDELKAGLFRVESKLQSQSEQIKSLQTAIERSSGQYRHQESLSNQIKRESLQSQHKLKKAHLKIDKLTCQHNQILMGQIRNDQRVRFLEAMMKAFIDYYQAEYDILEKKVRKQLGISSGEEELAEDVTKIQNTFNLLEEGSEEQIYRQKSSISPSTCLNPKIKNKTSVIEKNLQLQRQSQNVRQQSDLKIKQISLKLTELQNKHDQCLETLKIKQNQLACSLSLIQLLQASASQKEDTLNTLVQANKSQVQSVILRQKQEISDFEHKIQVLQTVIQGKQHRLFLLQTEIDVEKQSQIQLLVKINQLQKEIKLLKQQNDRKSKQNILLRQEAIGNGPQIAVDSKEEQENSDMQDELERQNQSDLSKDLQKNCSQPTFSRLILLQNQLELKQQAIEQLQSQLRQTLTIIKTLKEELEQREQIFWQEMNVRGQIEVNQQRDRPQHSYKLKLNDQTNNILRTSSDRFWQTKEQRKKQRIFRQYFDKIQEYYNQVLQVFGLEQITSNMINFQNLQNIISPRSNSSSKMNAKSLDQQQYQNEKHQQQEKHYQQETQNNLTSFQHEGIAQNSREMHETDLAQPQNKINSDPLEQVISYVSSNQEEVLRIINQWIRKLQRQSNSIHQHKEKSLYLQQRLVQMQDDNNQLSMEKLEIYDKYEAFISKLEQENTQLQEKSTELSQKFIDVQIYIKELEELLNATNNQCMKYGLFGLEIGKRQKISDIGRVYFNSNDTSVTIKQKLRRQKQAQIQLIHLKNIGVYSHQYLKYMSSSIIQCDTGMLTEQRQGGQSYWQQFYVKHGAFNRLNFQQSSKKHKQSSLNEQIQCQTRNNYNQEKTIDQDQIVSQKAVDTDAAYTINEAPDEKLSQIRQPYEIHELEIHEIKAQEQTDDKEVVAETQNFPQLNISIPDPFITALQGEFCEQIFQKEEQRDQTQQKRQKQQCKDTNDTCKKAAALQKEKFQLQQPEFNTLNEKQSNEIGKADRQSQVCRRQQQIQRLDTQKTQTQPTKNIKTN